MKALLTPTVATLWHRITGRDLGVLSVSVLSLVLHRLWPEMLGWDGVMAMIGGCFKVVAAEQIDREMAAAESMRTGDTTQQLDEIARQIELMSRTPCPT